MGIYYKNLDSETRAFMLQEDAIGGHYVSPRIEEGKMPLWRSLFLQALENHDDDWLASEASRHGLFKHTEIRRLQSGKTTVAKVPYNAAQQLAEGEFNRFYLRGIASRALKEGKKDLRIYRGKEVSAPRVESEEKVGSLIDAALLLAELRKNDFVDNALGLPAGPNSGLTAEIA